jgi:2-iminobutanoate/2-iminopropanoate deaminase
VDAIETNEAPRPIAPYSQGVDAGETVFVSGQLGIDPETSRIPEDAYEETRQLLRNLEAVLRAAGLTKTAVAKTTIFLTDLDDYADVNRAYGEFFEQPFPARSTVKVAGLLAGARVEIEAVAIRPDA